MRVSPVRTMDDYLRLLDDLVFELDELTVCAEQDMQGELDRFGGFYPGLARSLDSLRRELGEGRRQIGAARNLEWYDALRKVRSRVPLYTALDTVNRVYRDGLGDSIKPDNA